ncbi:MAG: hypothetical protein CK427_11045 [Leptospira sp.]|nr:MAG: hypothetical protein CK427_11045 [Leptospira sp.]
MNKKLIYAILGFVFLLLVLVFTEEKKENLTEEVYWKKNLREIQYVPPSDKWNKDTSAGFKLDHFTIKKIDEGGIDSSPIFSIISKSKLGQEIVYEAGYNAKNTFTELSVLKIKSAVEASEPYLKEFQINNESSPKLILKEKAEPFELVLGKEISEKSLTPYLLQNTILSSNSYTFKRFESDLNSFRERQLVNIGSGSIQKIRLNLNEGIVEIENSPEKNQDGNNTNSWRRNTGIRLVIAPNLGDELDGLLKALRIELYPDEDTKDGIQIIEELTRAETKESLEIWNSEGRKIKILLFPQTNIQEKDYIPVQRKIIGILDEFPAYTSVEVIQKIRESAQKIGKAEKWNKPIKSIQ